MESTSAHEGADISEGMVLQIMAAGTGRLQNVTQNLKQALLKKPRSMELISVVPQDVTNPMGEVVVQEMSFQLHEENLKHVMSTVEPGVPVAFVSVVGAFRSGKSFLLSCFLESLKTNDSDDTFENGFLGGKPGKTDGFSWRGGTKGHTQGITVWSKPFFREVDNGKGGRTKMAVLLVDTQGIFDHDVDTHLDACLFGLSTTLSSCQIFNVRNQVQADNLDSLAVYSEYGAIAKQNQTGGGQQSNAPFQRLEILIRNWQNWEDTADPMKVPCKTLRKKFVTYLDGILARRTAESAKVKECFRDDIGCFGLPHPGKDVEFHDFDGDINKIDEGFRRLVTYYVKNVIFGKLKTTNVPSLRYGGADVFVSSVKDIVQLFSDGLTNGELPDAGSWLGTINAAHNYNLMEEILNVFKGEMDKHTTAVMNPATLQTLLEEHKTTATGSFEPRGDEATKKEAKEVLLARLEKEANRMEARNSARMTWLGKGIAAIVDFFAAFGSAVQAVVSVVMVNLCVAGFCVVDWPQWAICAVGTFVGTVFSSLWGGIEEVGKETGKVLKSVSTFLQFLPPLATILIILVLAMIANVVFNFATLKVDSPYFTFANSSR